MSKGLILHHLALVEKDWSVVVMAFSKICLSVFYM
jgi:hypothetical protein